MPPDGGTLIVNEHFGSSVNLDRCLVQTRQPKRSDSHAGRRKPEPTSRLSRNLNRRRNCYPFVVFFRSIGVIFSLTTEGHIEVSQPLGNNAYSMAAKRSPGNSSNAQSGLSGYA
jgi:hypothetical protein